MLTEFPPKTENETVNKVTEMFERFNNRLALDNLRLGERYVKGEIHIIVHFSLACSDYVAVFERLSEVGEGNAADAHIGGTQKPGDCKSRSYHVDERSEQRMVLVGNVQIMENPESRALPASIRFGSVNGIYGALRHALYSSMTLGMVFRGKLPDGEAGLPVRRPAVDENELVGEVVKGGSKIVNHIPGDKSDFNGRGLNVENAIDVISRMRVMLAPDSIGLTVEEPLPRDFQITDVLFGPFNFYADERKPFVSGHEESP